MTTEPTYIDTHAPSPVHSEDVPNAPETLLRNVVAVGLAAAARKWEEGLPAIVDVETNRQRRLRWAQWFESFHVMTGAHDLYLALDALRQVDPARAAEVADRIVTGYEYGDTYEELLWEWCEEFGLDPQAISDEARAQAREFEATADDAAPSPRRTESRTA